MPSSCFHIGPNWYLPESVRISKIHISFIFLWFHLCRKVLNVIEKVKTFFFFIKTKSYPRLMLVSLNWKSEEALKIKVNIRLQYQMVHCKRYSHLLLASVNLSVEGHSEYLRQVVSNGYDKHTFTTYVFLGFMFSLWIYIFYTFTFLFNFEEKSWENSWVNVVVFDKGKTGAIKHALSSILTFDEIPTKLISSSQPTNSNFILAGNKF